MEAGSNNTVVSSLEENLKKALTELMILKLLSERDYYIGELTGTIRERSGNILSIVFPYAAFYRMIERGYIDEVKKRIAPDGRRRQYYQITDSGREYLSASINTYRQFMKGFEAILSGKEVTDDE